MPPPAKVVELGSAPGHQIAQLARMGYEATSVDLGAAEDAWGSGGQGEFRRILTAAGVEHLEWDLESLPFPIEDGRFDMAVMTEVIEHLREYPVRSLAETRRILRTDGRLYLTTPNQAYILKRLRLFAGRNVQTPLYDWIGGMPHARHAREYLVSELRELVEAAGFEVVWIGGRHFHVQSGNQRWVAASGKKALGRLAATRPTLGPSVIVVARNPPS
jgi:SAM-dependent methyltransferase